MGRRKHLTTGSCALCANTNAQHGLAVLRTMHLLTALLVSACFVRQAVAGSCGSAAAHLQLEEDWLEETGTQGGRKLPSVHDSLLGYSDWPEDQQGLPQQVTDKTPFLNHGCYPYLVSRFKWYKGTLYTDQAELSLGIRQDLVEMLLISKWLYKDLPDMDIMYNAADQAIRCNAELPMLQNTALDPTSSLTNEPFDINMAHLVYPLHGPEDFTVNYTRGFTIPYKDAWRHWSMSPGQMRAYSTCVQETYGNGVQTSAQPAVVHDGHRKLVGSKDSWAAARIPRLVWRGSTTGYFKGWPTGSSTRLGMYSDALEHAFWNKRLYMCAMARPYPWLDLGITHVYEDWVMRGQPPGEVQEVMKHLEPLVMRPGISSEAQSGYQLALSIDGNGSPWRLPKQMLGLTPIVKVDSPYKEFFAKRFKPGVHYESVRYDLTDLAFTAKKLIDEAAINSTRLQRMAVATQEEAVEHLNALGQLDSLVWALLKLKAAYAWPVEAPDKEQEIRWQPVILRPEEWSSHGLKHIRHRVERMFPRNFLTPDNPWVVSPQAPSSPSSPLPNSSQPQSSPPYPLMSLFPPPSSPSSQPSPPSGPSPSPSPLSANPRPLPSQKTSLSTSSSLPATPARQPSNPSTASSKSV